MEVTLNEIEKVANHILSNPEVWSIIERKIIPEIEKGVMEKKEVYSKFGERFRKIANLSDEEIEELVRNFLKFESNRHWTGLQRQVPNLLKDMKKLREVLEAIANDDIPLEEKVKKAKELRGMGKAIFSAILHVSSSGKYAIYNNKVYNSLEKLGIAKQLGLKQNIDDYPKINALVNAMVQKIRSKTGKEIGSWELDRVWQYYLCPSPELPEIGEENIIQQEREMRNLILENWDKIKGLEKIELLTTEDGEPLAEYPIDGGRIDILAKENNSLVVIELKVNLRTIDIGQILKYMCKIKERDIFKRNNFSDVKGLFIYQRESEEIGSILRWLRSRGIIIEKKKYIINVELKDE